MIEKEKPTTITFAGANGEIPEIMILVLTAVNWELTKPLICWKIISEEEWKNREATGDICRGVSRFFKQNSAGKPDSRSEYHLA